MARESNRPQGLAVRGWRGGFAIALGLGLSSTLTAETIYVGASEALCDATSIQEALDLVEATIADDEIRLTRTLAYTGVEIEIIEWDSDNTGDLVISGGWDDCLDATSTGKTTRRCRSASSSRWPWRRGSRPSRRR